MKNPLAIIFALILALTRLVGCTGGDSTDESVAPISIVVGYPNEKGDTDIGEDNSTDTDGDAAIYGIPLLEHLNDQALLIFAENFENDFPLSVSVRSDGEASGVPVTVTEPEVIRAVFEALCSITVLGEWPESGHTDDYLNYYFEMPNGSFIHGFVFQNGMLLDGWLGLYEITGFDALQEVLPAPGL